MVAPTRVEEAKGIVQAGPVMQLRPFRGNEDTLEWMDHAEAVQELNGWSDRTLALVVRASLQGDAARWWNVQKNGHPECTSFDWQELKELLLEQFATESAQALVARAYRTSQGTRTVKAYATDLNFLLSRVPGFPECEKLRIFIDNLRTEIRRGVRQQGPEDLPAAIKIACRLEAVNADNDDWSLEIRQLRQQVQDLTIACQRNAAHRGADQGRGREDNRRPEGGQPPRRDDRPPVECPKEQRRPQ